MMEVKSLKLEEMFKMLVKNKRLSHAFIFEGTNSLLNKESVFIFNKTIEKTLGVHNELIIVETEEKMLKKEAILDLKIDGEKTTMQDGYKIIAIIDAEKMNVYSANSLLKFIEEPVNNVIIILTTQNKYQILETINSRCQHIKLDMYIDTCKNVIYDNEVLKKICDMIYSIEVKKEHTLTKINELWNEDLEQKLSLEELIDLMIYFYKDLLNTLMNYDKKIYLEKFDNFFDKLIVYNKPNVIIDKISFLLDYREKLKYNINKSLFFDKLIICLSRSEIK